MMVRKRNNPIKMEITLKDKIIELKLTDRVYINMDISSRHINLSTVNTNIDVAHFNLDMRTMFFLDSEAFDVEVCSRGLGSNASVEDVANLLCAYDVLLEAVQRAKLKVNFYKPHIESGIFESYMERSERVRL